MTLTSQLIGRQKSLRRTPEFGRVTENYMIKTKAERISRKRLKRQRKVQGKRIFEAQQKHSSLKPKMVDMKLPPKKTSSWFWIKEIDRCRSIN